MQINRATDYAVRVMIHLATLPPGSKAQLIALEHATVFAAAFSPKSCNGWCMLGSWLQHRGNGGGFCLHVGSDKTSHREVIEAMEGPAHLNMCLTTGASCERKSWCGVHPVERAQATLRDVLAARLDRTVVSRHRSKSVEAPATRRSRER
jgi:DNA-binding IscR family transcriptional regulator